MQEQTAKQKKDLAVYHKVIKLSDLQVCIALAILEGLKTTIQSGSVRVVTEGGIDYFFNPLANNDQFVTLMQKYNVERTYQPYDMQGWSYHTIGGESPIHICERHDKYVADRPDRTMQQAACMAIILNRPEVLKDLKDLKLTEQTLPSR